MADRSIKLRDLRKILRRYGVSEDSSMGDGSHTMLLKKIGNGVYSYPVPTHSSDVLICYVKGCRKKFKLTKEDGISDKEFYGK
jgi:hypothetical protein